MYQKAFKHFPLIESIEVARRTICGFDNQKSHFSEVFLRFSQEPLKILKNKKRAFSLGFQEYTTKISIICHKQKVEMWPGQTIGTFDFTCRRRVTLNPGISATNQDFEKQKKKKVFLALGLRNVSQKFQISAMSRQFVVLIPKNHLFSGVFCGFLRNRP